MKALFVAVPLAMIAGGAIGSIMMGRQAPPPSQPSSASTQSVADTRSKDARTAAEFLLRSRLRITANLTLRGVQVFRQAHADTLAVCGQINPSGRSEDPFIPFVTVVTFDADRVGRSNLFLAASSAEATRVFIEFMDRCFEGGGPTITRPAVRPIPPLPDASAPRGTSQANPQAPPAVVPAAPPTMTHAPAAVQTSGSGFVTTSARHPVNIRSTPGGGSDVVRVVPRASNLQVFGEAPGGWLQIGEGTPWGWVHSSMLER